MADLTYASTMAMGDLAEFNVAFNQEFKVSIAALTHTKRVVGGAGGGQIMHGLIEGTEEPWSNRTNWSNPADLVEEAIVTATLLGIVQVNTAIEQFVDSVKSEHDSWLT